MRATGDHRPSPCLCALVATLAAAAVAPAGANTANTPAHTLPLRMQNGHPTTDVVLGNVATPLTFVVDSGAGASIVDTRVAREWDIAIPGAEAAVALGATGSSTRLKPTRSTTWRVGTLRFERPAVQSDLSAVWAGQPLAGILGNDVTAQWDTRWDFASDRLQLWTPGQLPASRQGSCQANASPQRADALQQFAFMRMRLGDAAVDAMAIVDTGASQTILNPAAAEALGLRLDGTDPRVRARSLGTRGVDGNTVPAWLHDLPALASGDWRHGPFEVRISDLPVFSVLGMAERPGLILGSDALRGSQLDIHAGAEQVCLRRMAAR